MSTISAGTTTTTALVETGDTTGNLVLQVNGTTPALTLNATQALGVGSSPSYGTSGQVLTSGGTSASPTWTTPSSGAMSLISTQTASASASLSWTGLTGDKYLLIYEALTVNGGSDVQIQFGTGSTTWITSGYISGGEWLNLNGSGSLQSANYLNVSGIFTDSQIGVGSTGGGNSGFSFINNMLCSNSSFTSATYSSYSQYTNTTSNIIQGNGVGVYNGSSTAKTAIRILAGTGNLVTGTASLYGISS